MASAAALAVLRIVDDEHLVEAAASKGEVLAGLLAQLTRDFSRACDEARGQGLLRGLVLRKGLTAREVLARMQARGVLLIAAGEQVLRFAPPLIVSSAQLEEGVAVLRSVLAEI